MKKKIPEPTPYYLLAVEHGKSIPVNMRRKEWVGVEVMVAANHKIVCAFRASDGKGTPFENRQANADFIVRACNSHAALLTACRLAKNSFEILKPELFVDAQGVAENRIKELQSAIEQGESGE